MRKQEFRFQTNLPSPARRGSRSRPPLRRPRPLRFERLRVPVWNPYGRGRLSPAKSEDRKGGEGKTDANLTIFFSTCCANRHPNSPPRPGEAPVHVHPFAARAPCDSKGSECQCGIHTAEAASALRSRKTERAAKEKPTPISQFFLAPAAPTGTPTRRHALGRLPTPPPLPENLLLRLHKKLPSEPPASTQEVSESENRPATRGTAHSEV